MNNRRPSKMWVLALLLLIIFTPAAFGQSYRAKVQGIVTDQTQAVVSGATVTLLNVATGVKVVRQSSDAGLYLFDFVDPGTYTITVELPGFSKFIQENIEVQTRGDVTVNATLQPGSVQESITVAETPVAVQFNSANRDFTIDSKMTNEIPRLDRNPFKLTLLAPSAVNTRGETMPYHSWAANSVDLGGGTNLKNDLQVDGSPIGIGHKNTVPPNQDAIQEVVVSTNSVDAESGHSAGGLISMTLKSGTNDFHGTAFYLGRYPWLNAEADRTTHSSNANRQHMMGGTLGNPILKNKLFNFFSLEYWKVGYPGAYTTTVPTPMERDGDFSQTYNINGGLKTIYDPYSTIYDPATGSVTRTPFAGNKVPSNRFDPLSAKLMKSMWDPNGPGDNITRVNNYKVGYTERYTYYNFSERVDYNINENWKVYGRYTRYHTDDIAPNPTPNNSELYVPTGTLRAGDEVSGDAVWTVNPRTVVNFHGSWGRVIDSYVSTPLGDEGWGSIWSNPWYKPYQDVSNQPIYFPYMNIGGNGFGGRDFYWNQTPAHEAFNAKISQQRGSHYLKAGIEHRRAYGLSYVSNTSRFYFPADVTANTFSSPNTQIVGNGYATFLLGALDGSSQMVGGPAPDNHNEYWGMFIQDDWKVTRRLTVNIGLRNDYETAYHDPEHVFSRGLDLNAPIPEMQARPPAMPAEALGLVGNNFYKWNGLWQWTSDDRAGMWDPQRFAWQPRIGMALRIDDRTALRVGYARYLTPTEMNIQAAPVSGFETVGFLSPPYFGVTGYQNTQGLLQGIPQATISDPFPASKNPLVPIKGKNSGTNVGRGGENLFWYPTNLRKPRNDRFNFNLQRQLPGEIVVSGTYFLNIGEQHYTKQYNNTNPTILAQLQNTRTKRVDNPFYHYLDTTLIPGPLYNQQQVELQSLLKPYPQYGGLWTIGTIGARERYQSVELKAQKAFSKGWNFLFAYVYIREKADNFFNDLDNYNNNLTYLDSNQPRHRISGAGTWELPFGTGRTFGSHMPRGLDAIVGGWKVTGMYTYMSGAYLRFGNLVVNGDPVLDNPKPEKWFNTAAFSPLPNNTYVIRSNPYQYDGLTGPSYWLIDGTLTKTFKITERFKAELKAAAYNLTNRLNRGNPNTDINSSQFGQTLYQGTPAATMGAQTSQLGNVSGRQMELGLKILF